MVAPILLGVLYVGLMSLIREPYRRRFNAVMVAGAGAAYLPPPARRAHHPVRARLVARLHDL